MRFLIVGLIILIIFITVAVSKTPKSNNKVAEQYFKDLAQSDITHKVDDIEKKFLNLFADFKLGATEEIIRQTYAKEFYFNDTFKVLDNIEDLIPYMVDTAAMVKSTTVDVLDVANSGTDYYIRWVMVMEFDVKRKDIYSKSIGMTQLRFNQKGKIIFHQDYWDSTEGFYQHLPYIGYFIRKVRSKL
jgi:hypothetical protein